MGKAPNSSSENLVLCGSTLTSFLDIVEDQQQESNWHKQKNRRGIRATCPSPRPVQPPTVSEKYDWYL